MTPVSGEQLHGVSAAASLPPDSCKETKVTPVPEEEREPLPPDASPAQVYQWRVRYHDLSHDPHQESVTEYFMKLYNSLGTYRPASPSFLSMLFPYVKNNFWVEGTEIIYFVLF